MFETLLARLVPWKWVAIALLAAAAVGFIGIQHAQILGLRAELATEKGDRARDIAELERQARAQTERNRLEDNRRRDEQTEIANESQRLSARARAGDVRAAAGDARLRDATTATAAACRGPTGDSTVAAASPAASSPGDLLALVQRRMGEAARGVVSFADDASIAGEACQRSYDTLRATPGP